MDCTRSFPGFFLVVSGLLLTQPVTANSQQIGESESDFVLEKGRVGRLKVGHQADDVIAMFGRDNTRIVNLNYEGMFTPALEIRLRGKEGPVGLIAEISGGCRGFMVGRIQVFDSRYRTPEGIGVGSTVRDAASHYWLRMSPQFWRESWSGSLGQSIERFAPAPSHRFWGTTEGLGTDHRGRYNTRLPLAVLSSGTSAFSFRVSATILHGSRNATR